MKKVLYTLVGVMVLGFAAVGAHTVWDKYDNDPKMDRKAKMEMKLEKLHDKWHAVQ